MVMPRRRWDTERMGFLSVLAKSAGVVVREDREALCSPTARSRKRGGNTVAMEIWTVGWDLKCFADAATRNEDRERGIWETVV